MTTQYTESFYAFADSNVSDAWDTSAGAGNAVRAGFRLALQRAGYGVNVSANDAKDTSGGFIVRPDPIYPERNALCHSSDVTPGTANRYSAAFRKRLSVSEKQQIIGFGLYIPPEYVANGNASTTAVFRVNATAWSDTAWWQEAIAPIYSAREVLRVCDDLSIRWGTDAAQSSRKLAVGAMNYVEFRISMGEVSVWIDDVFVMQKQVSVNPESIAFCFENNLNAGFGGTQMSGVPGRWALSNMYYLVNDGVYPSVRLGPTTRVIGMRPDEDINVHFNRPSAAPSNAAVAAQDLVDAPAWQLQASAVGDFDTYTSNDAAAKAAIMTMALVHTVSTKVLATNLEPDVHAVKPYVTQHGSSVEAAQAKVKEYRIIPVPNLIRNIRGVAVRPTDNTIWLACDAEAIWKSGANYNTDSWTRVQDKGTAVNFNHVYFDAAGNGLFAKGSGSNTVGWSWTTDGATINEGGNIPNTLAPSLLRWTQAPDGSRYIAISSYTVANNIATPVNPFNTTTASFFSVPVAQSGPVGAGWRTLARGGIGNSQVLMSKNDTTGILSVGTGSMSAAANFRTTDTSSNLNYGAITWDGIAWLIGANAFDAALGGAPSIRRSVDATSWSTPNPYGNGTAGGAAALNAAASNLTTHVSLFVGDAGAMVITEDGVNFRQLPRLTAQNLNCVAVIDNGDFIVGGNAGVLLRSYSPGTDTRLQPLAGYTMAFGTASINPVTGSVWTTAEAGAADFGVRLTS